MRALILAAGKRGERGAARLLGLGITERIVANLRKHLQPEQIIVAGDPELLPPSRRQQVRFIDGRGADSAVVDGVLAGAREEDLLVLAGDQVFHPELPGRIARLAGERRRSVARDGLALYLRGGDAPDLPGDATLNRMATQLIRAGLCEALTDEELFAIRVAGAADREQAIRSLVRLNWRPHDGLVAAAVNKHISVRISTALAESFITPNQMTIGAAVLGLIGVALSAWGSYWTFLGGAALMQVQSILDGCDGELSRMRYQSSRLGAWLDTAVDDVLGVLWVGCIGVGLYRMTGHWAYLAIGLGASAAHLVGSGLIYVALIKAGGVGHQDFTWWYEEDRDPHAEHRPPFLTYVVRRDFYVLLFLGLAAAGLMPAALLLSAGGALSLLVMSLMQVARRGFRQP